MGNVCVNRETLGHNGHSGRLVLAPQPRVWHLRTRLNPINFFHTMGINFKLLTVLALWVA